MLNMAELIFFDQTREKGILQTCIFKYVLNLDTNELTSVDEYLSYDDCILDVKEKKSVDFINNSSKIVILNKKPQISEFLPDDIRVFNLCEAHGNMKIEDIGILYGVYEKEDFLPTCLGYNLLNIAVFEQMLSRYEKTQVFKCFLGE